MSHFYGRLKGGRGPASRTGTKSSGLHTEAGSWSGGVSVDLWYDGQTGFDMCRVSLIRWQGVGVNRLLYEGPVNSWEPMNKLVLGDDRMV